MESDLKKKLQQFWELKELREPRERVVSPEKNYCKNLFKAMYMRYRPGRYAVYRCTACKERYVDRLE
ncbi:hypothetical protein HN011_006599 [Eciton burchellii]|nr:hypothetical protein HN011_006599 [Eciton burchellii]